MNAVKLDKLTKRLSRDIAANPKKAAILGLMVLVALYFWFPLLKDWAGGLTGNRTTAKAANVILTDDPVDDATAARRKPKETLKWEKVRQCVESDPWMASATFNPQWTNPFRLQRTPAEQAVDSAAVAALAQTTSTPPTLTEITPADAGLKVASVAVGPRMRSVTIAGDVYRENETIVAIAADGEQLEFRIVSITPREVRFERGGKIFSVELGRPRLAKGDRIVPIAETSGDAGPSN